MPDDTKLSGWEIAGLVTLGGVGALVLGKLLSKPAAAATSAFVPVSTTPARPPAEVTPTLPSQPPAPPPPAAPPVAPSGPIPTMPTGNPLLLQPRGVRQAVAATAEPPSARDLANLRVGDNVLVAMKDIAMHPQAPDLTEEQRRAIGIASPTAEAPVLIQDLVLDPAGNAIDQTGGLMTAFGNLHVVFPLAAITFISRGAEP